MQETILSTKDLSVGYPNKKKSKQILNQVNLNFKQGTLTALVGLNGAGKSTLLRTLTRTQMQLSGKIFLKGKDITLFSNQEIAQQISVVLTDKHIDLDLCVYELVQLGRTPYLSWQAALTKQDIEQIDKAIRLTQIEHLKDAPLSSLSDGQLQRALIARAIAQDTPIIILDEPSSHLDLHFKVSLCKLLQNLCKKENKTIIYSTHDIDIALAFNDNLIVLKDQHYHHDNIDVLIEQGLFDNFFPEEHLFFDKQQKRFRLKI